MGLKRSHWIMMASAALVVLLLSLAPRTPGKKAAEADTAGRVSEDPNSGSTPHAHDAATPGPVSKDPKVAAIIAELGAGAPPMQTILKLRELAEQDPTNVEAQYHLGLFSWQTGQYDKAMERFDRTIQLDPKGYPDAYAYLGQAYATLDSTDRAIQAIETYKTLVTDTALLREADAFLADIKNKQHP
ncbi:MAG TPA: tetratricopeptide repeat protein [Flavobacteriales bacterium]